MRVDRGVLGWGVFFICLGLVPLAARQGLVDPGSFAGIGELWPLILVAIGIAIVLSRTPIGPVIGLLVPALIGLALGAVLAGGVGGLSSCGGETRPGSVRSEGGRVLARETAFDVELSCGTLNVRPMTGSEWRLDALHEGQDGAPAVAESDSAIEIRPPDASDGGFFRRRRDDWTLSLPTDVRLDLSATVNASKAVLDLKGLDLAALDLTGNGADLDIDLTDATIDQLDASVNAAQLDLILPGSTNTTVDLTANAGSLRICLPPGSGARISTSETLASNNFAAAGFMRDDEAWVNSAYGSATNRIELSITANAASVTLDPEGGCRE
jgi:hypothetical protein